MARVPYRETVAVAGSAIAERGTPAQVAEWLAPALRGELVLTAALADAGRGRAGAAVGPGRAERRRRAEPNRAEPNKQGEPTRAEPTRAGWTLTGTKAAVPAGPLARVIVVSATTPDGPGLFAVTPDDAGVPVAGSGWSTRTTRAGWSCPASGYRRIA